MKGFFKKIFIIVLVLCVFYILLFSIRILDDGEIGIVEYPETNRVVSVYSGRINYVWRGAFFWLYRIYSISGTKSLLMNVSIPIPPLENLKADDYSVKIPINIVYRIKADSIYDKSILVNYGKGIDVYIRKFTRGQFERSLEEFMKPVYNPRMIENKISEIIAVTADNMKEELKGIGFEIVRIKRGGTIFLPDTVLVNDGIRFLGELRAIDREYKKQLLKAKNSINREEKLQMRHTIPN
jgi:regulator of protease activity HflC (stomatin/prohibitin superfamily)